MFTKHDLEGCGDVFVDDHEDVLTDVSGFSPGFEDDEAAWTIAEALESADRLLPPDVDPDGPIRNVSAVEHHEGFSEALTDAVPDGVDAYVDGNPTPGQCSVVLQPDDDDGVLGFTVQLQFEDPN